MVNYLSASMQYTVRVVSYLQRERNERSVHVLVLFQSYLKFVHFPKVLVLLVILYLYDTLPCPCSSVSVCLSTSFHKININVVLKVSFSHPLKKSIIFSL